MNSEHSDVDGLLNQAASLIDEGGHSEAFALLCALGVAARHLGADGAAYDFFRRCVAANPMDPVLLATAGSGLAEFADPDAESILRLAALSAPACAPARLEYGRYLAREGLTEDSIRELEAAARLGGEHATQAQLELGLAWLRAGDLAAANRALESAEQESWVLVIRALALLESTEHGDATELLHAASEAEPEDFEVQVLAALACAAEGWDDAAWNALARAELAAQDEDRPLLAEVEECLEDGGDAARALLVDELAPSVLRERLLQA